MLIALQVVGILLLVGLTSLMLLSLDAPSAVAVIILTVFILCLFRCPNGCGEEE